VLLCVCVHALKGKRLELSTTKVGITYICSPWQQVVKKSNVKVTRLLKNHTRTFTIVNCVADARRYDCSCLPLITHAYFWSPRNWLEVKRTPDVVDLFFYFCGRFFLVDVISVDLFSNRGR